MSQGAVDFSNGKIQHDQSDITHCNAINHNKSRCQAGQRSAALFVKWVAITT
jgi:hypothetical protein